MSQQAKKLSQNEVESGAFDVPAEQLYELYSQMVENYLLYKGVPRRESEDACQEVFLTVLADDGYHVAEVGRSRAPLGWLYAVATGVALNWRRKEKRQRTDLAEPESFEETADKDRLSDSQRLMRQEFLDQWGEAVAGFDEQLLEVFILCDIEGRSLPEVAQLLGIGRSSVIKRRNAARTAIEPIFERLRREQPAVRLVKPKKE